MNKLVSSGHITPLWQVATITQLAFKREKFNDPEQLKKWTDLGFKPRTGAMFDMRNEAQPSVTWDMIKVAEDSGLEHVGVSYYCMEPGDNLPYHSDTYKRYIKRFALEERKKDISRIIFFVADWEPGHIFEIDGTPFTKWKAGDWVAWRYDVPHMAANLGVINRYTIQVTGVIREDIEHE